MNTETTVSKSPRYDDESYPANQLERRADVYYEVSFRGVPNAHDKYLALKKSVLLGCIAMKNKAPALSYEADDVRHWASMPGGFVKQHMPWEVVVPRSLYRAFVHAIRSDDSDNGRAQYTAIRRYGRWV